MLFQQTKYGLRAQQNAKQISEPKKQNRIKRKIPQNKTKFKTQQNTKHNTT